MTGVDQVRRLACHWLLLRLAGTAPDDLITQCRYWLGQGRLLDIGRSVTYAVLSQHFRLAHPDIDLLAELLAADGADTSALSLVSVADFDPMPPCGFAPTRAGLGCGRCAAADTRPGPLLADAEAEDDIDRAAIGAAEQTPAVRALWRAWRFPGDGAPWPPPRRVYIVEVAFDADLAGTTAETQRRLAAAGEQVLGLGRQHHDLGARAVDVGRERLADAQEHADLGDHQQAREGKRHHGGQVAAPLVEQCR